MTDREFLESLLAQIQVQLTPPVPSIPPPPPAPSPTGYEPLLWTENRQRIYNRMLAEAEAGETTLGAKLFNFAKSRANTANAYADNGLWAAFMYQATGLTSWATTAWTRMQPWLASAHSDLNTLREQGFERVVVFDMVKPSLTQVQIDLALASIDLMCTNALTPAAGVSPDFPVRSIDSDQITGTYMLLAAHMLSNPLHGPAQEFFARPYVGGLVSTGRNRDTMRNCITDYVAMAEGGEWIESSEYNLGTVRLLLQGVAAINIAQGTDCFPEVTAWLPEAAKRTVGMLSPDLRREMQWGDVQEPNILWPWRHTSTAGMIDHPIARGLFSSLMTKYATGTGNGSPDPLARTLLHVDPYGLTATGPLNFNATGQGIVTAKSNLTPDASMFFSQFTKTPDVAPADHGTGYHGDIQLYRKGDWALRHPHMYAGYGFDGRANNTVLFCGLGAPKEFRGANEVFFGPDYVFTAGTCGGSYFDAGSYQPPPPYLHEFSRSVVWIPGVSDTIVVFDRTNAQDPRLLSTGITKYHASSQRPKMVSAPVKEWRWHAWTLPTINGNVAEWVTAGNETARVTWFGALTPSVVDQSVAFGSPCALSERKFHVSLSTNVEGFSTVITVLQFGDPATFTPITFHGEGLISAGGKLLNFTTTAGPALLTNRNPLNQETLANVRGIWAI